MAKDWTKIYKKYRGLWVALAADEVTVLASGKILQQTLEDAHKKGYKNPIMTRMPENLATFVGVL